MSHSDAIENNYDVLLRCTTINYYVIDFLKAEAVLDRMQESELRTQRNPLKQCILLFQWLKEVSSDRYESFLQVMKDTEQEHVANLLRGSTEEGHLPLSELRHQRLDKIRPRLANVICIDSEVIAELRRSKAISRTDAEEIRAEKVDYVKSSKLISVIMRRSNHCYNSFQEVLRKTLQSAAAEFLSEGEMPAVHVNNNRPDMDGILSSTFNEAIRKKSKVSTDIKELLSEINGIGVNLVKAIPGQSIVIFVYCKTAQNAVTFSQLFNSGRLRNILEGILNRLLLTIEPHNMKTLDSSINIDDEEVITLEEFTGVEGFMRESLNRPKLSGKKRGCDANTQTEEVSFMKKITGWVRESLYWLLPLSTTDECDASTQTDEESLSLRKEEETREGTNEKQQRKDFGTLEKYRNISHQLLRDLEEEEFQQEQYIYQCERSKQRQLESIDYSRLKVSHADAIERNNDVLIRCTTVNFNVIDLLRAEDVIDEEQEHDLRTERSNLKQCIILFQWLKEVPSDKYESFLQVMKDTEQEHVANLLSGSTEEDHLPLSDSRYTHLIQNRLYIMTGVWIDNEVLAELRSSKAISTTDAEDIMAEKFDFGKISKLICAIIRRSNHSYNSFQEVLRKTRQTAAAEFLSEEKQYLSRLPLRKQFLPKHRYWDIQGIRIRGEHSRLKYEELELKQQAENNRLKEQIQHKKRILVKLLYKSDPVLVQTIRTKAAGEERKSIRGLTILDRELFVVSEESSEVEVYDSMEFSFSGLWNLKELIDPMDLGSCNRNKCLYITASKYHLHQPNEIFRVNPRGKLIKKWSTEDDSGIYWGCGLSVTGESNVVLTIFSKSKLNEYSPDGQLIREIHLSHSGVRHPFHAIKLTTGNFVISHAECGYGLQRMCEVDTGGKLKKSYGGKPGSTVAQMNRPLYLSVDENGFVMVADRLKSRVLILDSDLEFQRELLSKERHGLRDPLRILLDESSGRLFVADNDSDNQRILIFSILNTDK